MLNAGTSTSGKPIPTNPKVKPPIRAATKVRTYNKMASPGATFLELASWQGSAGE
jgi:hypothetical protein